jgi:hypothetical protein
MENKHNLRFEFVGMLFALAIGQVAIECGDIVMKDLIGWQYLYIYVHLLLATVIIATSWVGWQSSHSFGNTRLISSNFSSQFVILLVDIFLVICYFIIVRGAEEYYKGPTGRQKDPDGRNQTLWTLIIFATYFLWDVLTKLFIPFYQEKPDDDGTKTYIKQTRADFTTFWSRARYTLICLALAIFAYFDMGGERSGGKIICLDLYLIFVFVLFRGLKELRSLEDYMTNSYNLAEADIGKATLKMMVKHNVTYPIKVVRKESKYKRRIWIFIVFPSVGVAICTFCYFW